MRDDSLMLAQLEGAEIQVIDVGSGTGFTTEGIVKRVAPQQVTCVDQSPHQMAKAKAKPSLHGCTFKLGDAENIPFPTDQFDRYVSAGSIEYWPNPQKGVTEAYRVIKEGGIATLIGPLDPPNPLVSFVANTWMLFPKDEEYRDWFKQAGFEDIQHFYDQSTPLWLKVWGEHMHHGFYEQGEAGRKSHTQAQLDLVAELLKWGKVNAANTILDAGCGVGGSARLLATQFDAQVLGLTLSPVQAANGQQYNREAGLEQQVRLEVKDMMSMAGSDQKFDLIWSLESAEHIADKAALLEMFYELLNPGGRLIMATWCHRETPPELSAAEQGLLERIYKLYHLPPMELLGLTLLSCLGANIYIVGLNQITDVEIDKINKPYLPLASGAFSMRQGYFIVGLSLLVSLAIAIYLGKYR
eukprot:g465.t1